MILPYKVKNPPKKFPAATVTLIALNVLVYMMTTHGLLVIRREMLDSYALRWGISPLHTILTAMFLHGSILHLVGNMLFLWVFGPAVEDRVGIPLYLGLYFLTGFAGDVAEAALGAAGAVGVSVPLIGASGCIMGLLGAYWYMYSWSPVCMFYWIFWFFRGTFEVAAIWVIGAYFLMDLTSGFVAKSAGAVGGVANFAHVGGAIAGALLVAGLGFKRDSSEVSRVKATHAELKDVNLLSCDDLKKLILASPEDEHLLISHALRAMDDDHAEHIRFALLRNPRVVMASCPEVAVHYLLALNGSHETFSAGDLVYLGKHCEAKGADGQALVIYQLVEANHPDARELEMALYRCAFIHWQTNHNASKSLERLDALLMKFPAGALMFEAEDLRADILRIQPDAKAA